MGLKVAICLFLTVSLWLRFYEAGRHAKMKSHGVVRHHSTLMGLQVSMIGILLFSILELFFVTHEVLLAVSTFGLALFLTANFIRSKVRRDLGILWSWDIEIRENHQLIQSGLYRYCRHPNYLGLVLEIVGICLLTNSLITFLIGFPLFLTALFYRIHLEESAMIEKFGQQYLAYKTSKKAIIPWFI